MVLDKIWFENLVKKQDKNNTISKIISIDIKPGVDKGENYMSIIERINAVILLNSGQTDKRCFILKKSPNTSISEDMKKEKVFETEIQVYQNVLPQMEHLISEFNDRKSDEIMWAEYFGTTDNFDRLLFEDLTESGFRLANRKSAFDKTHALFTLKSLARFHAISIVLLKRGKIIESDFQPFIICRNLDFFKDFYCGNFELLEDVIRTTWDEEWSWVVDMMTKMRQILGVRLKELYEEDYPLKVFCHGDCWVNNIMFKYSEENNLTGIKFLDFQISHINSFAWDLTFLFYSSIRPDLRHQEFDSLLSYYRDSLLKELQFYNNDLIDLVPTLEVMKKEMDRLLFSGLANTLGDLQFMLSDSDDIPDDLVGDDYKTKVKKMYLNEKCKKLLQIELTFFKQKIDSGEFKF